MLHAVSHASRNHNRAGYNIAITHRCPASWRTPATRVLQCAIGGGMDPDEALVRCSYDRHYGIFGLVVTRCKCQTLSDVVAAVSASASTPERAA